MGWRPTGSIPARPATTSPHAPEALITAVHSISPSGVETRHPRADPGETGDRRRHPKLGTGLPGDAHERLVEGGDVDVEGVWLIEASGDPFRPHLRDEPEDLVSVDQDRPGTEGLPVSGDCAQTIEPSLVGHPEEAAIREQRGVGRVLRRVFEESPARQAPEGGSRRRRSWRRTSPRTDRWCGKRGFAPIRAESQSHEGRDGRQPRRRRFRLR